MDRITEGPRTRALCAALASAALAALTLGGLPALAEGQAEYAPSPVPSRIVLNPTAHPQTSQAFTWRTDSDTLDGAVQITEPDGTPVATVAAQAGNPVSFSGWTHESIHHSAVVTGLEPETEYAYRVGGEVGWSAWMRFRTASDGAEPWNMLYFGDAQNDLKERWTPVVRMAFGETPGVDLSLHAGDLINDADADHEWGEWFEAIGTSAATIPAVVTPGNHEQSGDPAMRQFREHFTNPLNGPLGEDEVVHYTDFQGVRFVSLNTNAGSNPISLLLQRQWLDEVLASNPNRWSVVTFHHPVYSVSEGRSNPTIRAAFADVLEEREVDLVLQGHDHSYGRGHLSEHQTDVEGVHDGPVYAVAVSGPKYYDLAPEDGNDWTGSGATRAVAYQQASTFQQIQFEDDVIRYRAVVAAKGEESNAGAEVGQTLDSFTIRKFPDGSRRVSEGVRFPSRTAASADPAEAGAAMPVDVAVSSVPMPRGVVELSAGGSVLATANLADGEAELTVPGAALEPGRHRASVEFLGGEEVQPSSAELELIVTPRPAAGGAAGETARTPKSGKRKCKPKRKGKAARKRCTKSGKRKCKPKRKGKAARKRCKRR